jgi:rubrerythrin
MITDELREWGNRWEDAVALEIKEIADRIDAEHAYQMAECRLVREHFGRCGNRYRLVCSECHHIIYDGWQEKPRYCPFCGRRVNA